MSEQQYYLGVRPHFNFPMIEIEIRTDFYPLSGCVSAVAALNEKGEVITYVLPSVTLSGSYTPAEIYKRINWLAIAAEATELLASMIKTPDDLKRPVEARMSDGFIIIEFCKGA
jgi:hypothetical protein